MGPEDAEVLGEKQSLTQRKCVCDNGGRNEEKSLRTSDEGQTEWVVRTGRPADKQPFSYADRSCSLAHTVL